MGHRTSPHSRPWNDVISAAELAAGRLRDVGSDARERRDQQPAMRRALATAAGWSVDSREATLRLRGWCHPPRGIDVAATDPAGRRWIGELKMRKTDELLWDLVKLADGLRDPAVAAGFLLVGAARAGTRPGMCAELLEGESVRHDTLALFSANRRAWSNLLQGGTARPIELPRAITTKLMAEPEIRLDGSPARLALVAVIPDWSRIITADPDWWSGDWPPAVEPDHAYLEWRARHCRFLQDLDAAGPLEHEHAQSLSKRHRLDLERDAALTHTCKPLVSPKPTRTVTPAGRSFVAQWARRLLTAI